MKDCSLAIGALFVVGVAFAWLKNKLPNMLGKWLDTKIDYLFEKGGPEEDKLIYALVVYAEEKMKREFPGDKKGKEKFKLVADKVIKLIAPVLDFLPGFIKTAVLKKSGKLAEVIERSVKVMKHVLEEHKSEVKNTIDGGEKTAG